MSKITLSSLTSLESQSSFLATLNANFSAIQTALDNTLSRNGQAPNTLSASIDFNSFTGLNIPKGVNPTDIARMDNLTGLTGATGATGATGPQGPQGLSGNGSGDVIKANNLSELTNFATARSNLGLAIGTNVQAYSAGLLSISTAAAASGNLKFLAFTAANVATTLSYTAAGLAMFQAADVPAQRTLLGLAGAALLAVGTTAGTVAAGDDSRFHNEPINQQDANYHFVIGDRDKVVRSNSGSAYAWTIDPSIWTVGDFLTIRAGIASGNITITRGAGVNLYKAGSVTSANVVMAAGGFATLYMEATDTWVISGTGLT